MTCVAQVPLWEGLATPTTEMGQSDLILLSQIESILKCVFINILIIRAVATTKMVGVPTEGF